MLPALAPSLMRKLSMLFTQTRATDPCTVSPASAITFQAG